MAILKMRAGRWGLHRNPHDDGGGLGGGTLGGPQVYERWGIRLQVLGEMPHGNHGLPLTTLRGIGQ